MNRLRIFEMIERKPAPSIVSALIVSIARISPRRRSSAIRAAKSDLTVVIVYIEKNMIYINN